MTVDFPFAKPEHRAAWLAFVLTPLARHAFSGPSPLFLIDANTRGSGKSLLADVGGILATGTTLARMSNPRDDEECRKRITALALAGDSMVLIDNIIGNLGCASLDAALTSPDSWKDRILGKSEMVELPLSLTWTATGNNVMLEADTSRRTLQIRLDSPEENPELRSGFQIPHLVAHVKQQRAALVAAGLTILSAYHTAGRPRMNLPPWGSFDAWSALIREADFKSFNGRRQRLRLGIVSHDDAEECCRRVEKLVVAKRLNQAPDLPTVEWMLGLPDELHAKLARFGLVESRAPEHAAPSLGVWLEKYLSQRTSELKPGSLERLRQTGDRLKAHFGEAVPIDEVTPNQAADWRADMLTSGLSEATTRLHCRNAKSIFTGAIDRELIPRNPFGKLKSSAIAANRNRYVTPNETWAILDACPSVAWRVVFGLARLAGLRIPSESHRLTWGDLDFEKRRLTVYAPKTDSTRIVPIIPALFTILQDAFDAAPEGSDKIVRLSAHNLHRDFEKLITRAGLVPWDDLFQTLRRSCENDFARHHPQHEVSRWIGHSMRVSEQHYLMADESTLQAATRPDSHNDPFAAPTPPVLATTSEELLRAAQSAAVGSRIASQVQETRRNTTLATTRLATPGKAKNPCFAGVSEVARAGIEPATPGFSVLCSTN